jgi:arsenate reductase (thioredoxin)
MSGFDPVVQRRLDNLADELVADYADEFEPRAIRALMADSAARLAESAVFPDFLPPLAFRLTKERLSASTRTEQQRVDGAFDVVFVSLGGGGRGQIAAALTTLLSGDKVVAHSAGTAVEGEIDPGVSAAIGELGIDVTDAFARPVTPEVLRAANLVVTMGHSVGAFDIPEGVRHEDWRVGDPVGAPMEEIRRVRDDIERRVRALLDRLGVETVPPGVAAALPH